MGRAPVSDDTEPVTLSPSCFKSSVTVRSPCGVTATEAQAPAISAGSAAAAEEAFRSAVQIPFRSAPTCS